MYMHINIPTCMKFVQSFGYEYKYEIQIHNHKHALKTSDTFNLFQNKNRTQTYSLDLEFRAVCPRLKSFLFYVWMTMIGGKPTET